MIEYVDARLREWGIWQAAELEGSSSRVISSCYGGPSYGGGFHSTVPMRERCVITADAVVLLGRHRPPLARAVLLHYLELAGHPAAECAAVLGKSRAQYFKILDRAHADILGFLAERESPRLKATPAGLVALS